MTSSEKPFSYWAGTLAKLVRILKTAVRLGDSLRRLRGLNRTRVILMVMIYYGERAQLTTMRKWTLDKMWEEAGTHFQASPPSGAPKMCLFSQPPQGSFPSYSDTNSMVPAQNRYAGQRSTAKDAEATQTHSPI